MTSGIFLSQTINTLDLGCSKIFMDLNLGCFFLCWADKHHGNKKLLREHQLPVNNLLFPHQLNMQETVCSIDGMMTSRG